MRHMISISSVSFILFEKLGELMSYIHNISPQKKVKLEAAQDGFNAPGDVVLRNGEIDSLFYSAF